MLLGQKYGYRPLPTIIPATELEMLCDVISAEEPSAGDVQLLQQWYKKDKNSIEPIYVLQSISSIITNFKNKVLYSAASKNTRLNKTHVASLWLLFVVVFLLM